MASAGAKEFSRFFGRARAGDIESESLTPFTAKGEHSHLSDQLEMSGRCHQIGVLAWLLGACLAAGCSNNPAAPDQSFSLSCPVDQSIHATGQTTPLFYSTPTVNGGTAPVSVNCSPPSGSGFPMGFSSVNCSAKDAQQQAAACAFSVTVTPPPTLSLTRFVAFGDSITYGVLSPCRFGALSAFNRFKDLALLRASVDVAASYPTKLQRQLESRYTMQKPAVLNEGVPGETVEEGAARLPAVLSQDQPEVLLLQEGANNINSTDPASISDVVDGLRQMIRTARGRGVRVFVATLLPQREGACRGYAPGLVAPANDQIRPMVSAEGAVLVDLYPTFLAQLDTLIGVDGLHPNEAGYEEMARLFFDAISRTLEIRFISRPS